MYVLSEDCLVLYTLALFNQTCIDLEAIFHIVTNDLSQAKNGLQLANILCQEFILDLSFKHSQVLTSSRYQSEISVPF